LTLGHEEHLRDVVAAYGTDVDLDVIRVVVVVAKPAGRPPAGWSSTASTRSRQAASSTC
jgi:hypothetical protein